MDDIPGRRICEYALGKGVHGYYLHEEILFYVHDSTNIIKRMRLNPSELDRIASAEESGEDLMGVCLKIFKDARECTFLNMFNLMETGNNPKDCKVRISKSTGL